MCLEIDAKRGVGSLPLRTVPNYQSTLAQPPKGLGLGLVSKKYHKYFNEISKWYIMKNWWKWNIIWERVEARAKTHQYFNAGCTFLLQLVIKYLSQTVMIKNIKNIKYLPGSKTILVQHHELMKSIWEIIQPHFLQTTASRSQMWNYNNFFCRELELKRRSMIFELYHAAP